MVKLVGGGSVINGAYTVLLKYAQSSKLCSLNMNRIRRDESKQFLLVVSSIRQYSIRKIIQIFFILTKLLWKSLVYIIASFIYKSYQIININTKKIMNKSG